MSPRVWKRPNGKDVWPTDSNSEQDLISKAALRNCKRKHHCFRNRRHHALCEPAQPYIHESSPAVLSLGVKCLDQGSSFHWESGKAPTMVRPDGVLIQLKVDGHVPYMDSSCEAEPSFSAAAASKPAPEPVHDEGLDEGDDPDDEVERFVRSRKEQDLLVDACPIARSKGGQGRLETKAFGDRIIVDHVILKANIEPGIQGEWCALVIKDVRTQFRYVYPSTSKSTEQSVAGIQHLHFR